MNIQRQIKQRTEYVKPLHRAMKINIKYNHPMKLMIEFVILLRAALKINTNYTRPIQHTIEYAKIFTKKL